MAFLNRGNIPSVNNGGNNIRHPYCIEGFFYTYVPLDNTYVIMQMIITFIILIVGGITLLVTYKSNIVDPIENIKNMFINSHLITILVFVVLSFVITFVSKRETQLVKSLILITLISSIAMIVFLGIKVNLDTTYNSKKFEQFYNEQNTTQKEELKNKIDIGITGIALKTEKQYYIDECMELYNVFKIKSYGTLILHLLLNMLLVYQIIRVQKGNSKKEKLNKDDIILFDEEENVKM